LRPLWLSFQSALAAAVTRVYYVVCSDAFELMLMDANPPPPRGMFSARQRGEPERNP